MIAYDFEYDGERLSDNGFQLCTFDGGGLNTISNGSVITFNQISTLGGQKYLLTSSAYEECLTTTIQICKRICDQDVELKITQAEMRHIMQWLNRKEFHELVFLGDPLLDGVRFYASFNVNKVEYGGELFGLELEVLTDRPFGLGEEINQTIRLRTPYEDPEADNTGRSLSFDIESTSDEEGFIYPDSVLIVPYEKGDFSLVNTLEDHEVSIKGVQIGEKIQMDYPIILTNRSDHKVQNDFNWNYFRIANTYRNHTNHYTSSLPCNITITYSPIIKIGF